MNVDALVLAEGDGLSAWGRLVRDERGTWFEPPLPQPLILYADPPVKRAWHGAVAVSGADFGDVEDHRERGGVVEGWATLDGTWAAGRLTVNRQSAQRPARDADDDDFPDWAEPPCRPPADGWPRWAKAERRDNLEFDIGDLRETGAAVAVTTFRPGRRQAVLVVAAADADAVEAGLRPHLGDRLCIVPSRWTRAELRAVHDQLSGSWDDWRLYGLAEINTGDGQARITANLTRVLPAIAAWAAPLPQDILTLRPWLAPA